MDIIGKILDKIAKTKEDSLVSGGFLLGFALATAIFGFEDDFDFGLIDILGVLVINMLLCLGVCLTVRGRRAISEEDEEENEI